MQKKQWLRAAVSLMLVRGLMVAAFAQEPGEMPAAAAANPSSAMSHSHRGVVRSGFTGFQGRMDHAVGLTPEQRDAVRGLLAQQHQDLQAVREKTDTQIRAMLNPDQQKKFDTFLAQQKQERSARYQRAS